MRLRGQHVPQAPLAALGRLNFVFSAPVCLFPSRRPQDSLLIRVQRHLSAPLGPSRVEGRSPLDEVGSGVVINNNNTASRTPPVVGNSHLALGI